MRNRFKKKHLPHDYSIPEDFLIYSIFPVSFDILYPLLKSLELPTLDVFLNIHKETCKHMKHIRK